MSDLQANPDFGLGWLDGAGPYSDIVLSTRVRLARNLQGHPYVCRASDEDRKAVFDAVAGAIEKTSFAGGGAVLFRMEEMKHRNRHIFLERRLVSRDLLDKETGKPSPGTAVFVFSGNPASMMVNEEDHLRLQCLVSGLRFMEAWGLADRLDEEISPYLFLAYHREFGYLTSCPTNAGTGLRASALAHLPGLVLTKEFEKVFRGIAQVGLTVRGLHGEGSEVMGNFFQISNQTTLGKSEEDLVDHLAQVVGMVIQTELQARQILMRDAASVTEDKVWRAYGLLRYARSLPYRELINLLSGVRLGVSLKILPSLRVSMLNELMIFSQTAHLEEAAGKELSKLERHAQRAEYVRAVLREGRGGIPFDPTG